MELVERDIKTVNMTFHFSKDFEKRMNLLSRGIEKFLKGPK